MDEFNRPNRSPNPEGRFTLFPGKNDPATGRPTPKTFTLTRDHQDLVGDLAARASAATGRKISQSDIVGAAVEKSKGDLVAWIVSEVERRHAETAGTAEGGPPGALPAAGP